MNTKGHFKQSAIALAVVAASALSTAAMHANPAQKTGHPAAAAHSAAGGANKSAPQKGNLDAAYHSYISQLRSKLDNKWYLADGHNKVTLTLHLAPDGSVTDLNVQSSPSNTQAEQAASDAFNQSQPLPSLPSGSQAVTLTLVFTSYADPHGANNRDLTGTITPLATAAPSKSSEASQSGSSSSSASSSSDTNSQTQSAEHN